MGTKLTKKEIACFDEVNAVLARCPSPDKFGYYTVGYSTISVYDRNKEAAINRLMDTGRSQDWCVAVRDANAEIDEQIYFPQDVLSTAG